MNLTRVFSVMAFIFSLMVFVQTTTADEPGWYPYTIARGADRAKIENTPILERPYRPLHFYGNTVRRRALPRQSHGDAAGYGSGNDDSGHRFSSALDSQTRVFPVCPLIAFFS